VINCCQFCFNFAFILLQFCFNFASNFNLCQCSTAAAAAAAVSAYSHAPAAVAAAARVSHTAAAPAAAPAAVAAAAAAAAAPAAGGDEASAVRSAQAAQRMAHGRGVIENTHSTDVESPPSPLRVCMSIHAEGKSCSDLGSNACSQ